jgi:hypothetical protein
MASLLLFAIPDFVPGTLPRHYLPSGEDQELTLKSNTNIIGYVVFGKKAEGWAKPIGVV